MKSQANVAVQHKGFGLDGFYLKGFHYQQPNDLKLLRFLSLCRIKGSERVLCFKGNKQSVWQGIPYSGYLS